MNRRAWIVLALSCALCGADIIDDGLAHIEKLSQMTSAQREKLSKMVLHTRNSALQHHKTHTAALNHEAQFHTEMAMRKAETLRCHPAVSRDIAMISENNLSGWHACLEISIPLENMIQLGVNFTKSLQDSETIICSGIRNITLCNETASYDKFVCVSGAIGQATSYYMNNTKSLLYWIGQLDDIVEQLGLKIAECLNITKISLFTDIDSKFDHRCPVSSKNVPPIHNQ